MKKFRFLNEYTNYNRFLDLRKRYEDKSLSYRNTNADEYYNLVYNWSEKALNDLIKVTEEETGIKVSRKFRIEHAINTKRLKTNVKAALKEIVEEFKSLLPENLESNSVDEINNFKKSIADKFSKENLSKEEALEEILNDYYHRLSTIKKSELKFENKIKYIHYLNYTLQQETK